MSDRAAFEAEEIRGLAERYGGRRVPGELGYRFSPLCWCCPHYERQELVLADGADRKDSKAWACPKGCRRSTEDGALRKACPTGLSGHARGQQTPPLRAPAGEWRMMGDAD